MTNGLDVKLELESLNIPTPAVFAKSTKKNVRRKKMFLI